MANGAPSALADAARRWGHWGDDARPNDVSGSPRYTPRPLDERGGGIAASGPPILRERAAGASTGRHDAAHRLDGRAGRHGGLIKRPVVRVRRDDSRGR